ncbi:MAG TPA: hypothetical protein VN709_01990 [Terriglobales bacterium]|nr:hypothetical protein [Terriglobales bacterium]
MPIHVDPIEIEVIAADPWPPIAAQTGIGIAAWIEAMLTRAGATEGAITGHIWISDRWQADVIVNAKRHSEEAAFDQGHHCLYRLVQFAASELKLELPDPLTRAFDDWQTHSPGALLAYFAGDYRRAFELDPTMPAPRIALARQQLARPDGMSDARAAAGIMQGVTVHDAQAAAELGIAIWAGAPAAGEAAAAVAEIAAQLLQQAVKANPDDAVAAAALAALLVRRGAEGQALDEALLLATHATQLAADDFRCWAALADVHRAQGDMQQAGFFYGFALRLEPNAPTVLKDAAATWLIARDLDRALPLIEQALALAPADAENWGNLAFARDLAGTPAPALEAARQATGANPADPRLHILHGDLALKAGKKSEALDAWARATAIDSSLLINPQGGNIGI